MAYSYDGEFKITIERGNKELSAELDKFFIIVRHPESEGMILQLCLNGSDLRWLMDDIKECLK